MRRVARKNRRTGRPHYRLARAASGLPFLLADGLKIVYELDLYFRFR